MTILEIINKTTPFFEHYKINDPRLTCELLLGNVLKLSRVELYMQFDRPLTSSEMDKMREMVRRRKNREPIQYIIGEVNFRDVKLSVSPAVLIPRPETEIVAGVAIDILKKRNNCDVLDIGTGSGAIAISIKKELPECNVTASDISEYALIVADENSKKNNVEINFIYSNLFENISGVYDLIISNPPYITSRDIEDLQPEIKDFEPLSALDGGKDGLSFYRLIISSAAKFLKDGASLVFEIGKDQEKDIKIMAEEYSFVASGFYKDLNGIVRALVLDKK